MEPIEFSAKREDILAALNKLPRDTFLPAEPNGVSLVDGFINIPLANSLSGNIVIGGPSIPVVAVVGNTTGLIYHFAYKILVKD